MMIYDWWLVNDLRKLQHGKWSQHAVPRHVRALHFAVPAWCLATLVSAATGAGNSKRPPTDKTPAVTKVEPPNWWVGLTPEVMVLFRGAGSMRIRWSAIFRA